MSDDNSNKNPKVNFFSVIQSVLAAVIGVQSEKNRQRDFTHGKPIYFIIAGLIFIVVFIGVIVAVVQMVLPSTS
jgi:hypothetical protein